jgi:hypothetical protein
MNPVISDISDGNFNSKIHQGKRKATEISSVQVSFLIMSNIFIFGNFPRK